MTVVVLPLLAGRLFPFHRSTRYSLYFQIIQYFFKCHDSHWRQRWMKCIGPRWLGLWPFTARSFWVLGAAWSPKTWIWRGGDWLLHCKLTLMLYVGPGMVWWFLWKVTCLSPKDSWDGPLLPVPRSVGWVMFLWHDWITFIGKHPVQPWEGFTRWLSLLRRLVMEALCLNTEL